MISPTFISCFDPWKYQQPHPTRFTTQLNPLIVLVHIQQNRMLLYAMHVFFAVLVLSVIFVDSSYFVRNMLSLAQDKDRLFVLITLKTFLTFDRRNCLGARRQPWNRRGSSWRTNTAKRWLWLWLKKPIIASIQNCYPSFRILIFSVSMCRLRESSVELKSSGARGWRRLKRMAGKK